MTKAQPESEQDLPQQAGQLLGAHRAFALAASWLRGVGLSARDSVGSKQCRQRAS